MQEPGRRPRLAVPQGACDTHIHVFEKGFPVAPTAASQPPEAPLAPYLDLRQRLGIARTIVVQPSAYGTDNGCTLQAVAAMGDTARAVVVVDETASGDALRTLTAQGARGLRFHMLPGGVLGWEKLETLASRVAEHGWHIQLQLDGRLLPERADMLRRLPGLLVVDHTGKFFEPVPPDHPAFRVLLDMVERGRTYVKLSAPYETSKAGRPAFADVSVLAKTLAGAAPERMLWASNWPHQGSTPDRVGDEADLLDLVLDWAPDERARQQILVDNPARVYGF